MRVDLVTAWYDVWIGAYWDKRRSWLFILPIPCIGIVIKFREELDPNSYQHDRYHDWYGSECTPECPYVVGLK